LLGLDGQEVGAGLKFDPQPELPWSVLFDFTAFGWETDCWDNES